VTRCQCSQWSGEPCGSSEPPSVLVEFMPVRHRDAHTDGGNRGVYPHNGAVRVTVTPACADLMVASNGDWCAVVGIAYEVAP